jgi:hypothetical protein
MKKIHLSVWLSILRTFDNSWKDIDYKYQSLTSKEKKVMTETEFNNIVSEIEALKEEEKNGIVYK